MKTLKIYPILRIQFQIYKDILMLEQIKKPEKLLKLLQAIAFQTGNQVSYSELGLLCGLDSKTVEKYIVLLEDAGAEGCVKLPTVRPAAYSW
jgi:predicted AAA+ superfamily ATPase